MKIVPYGVCAPRGFIAAGINCGIKKKEDLALIYSEVPAVACGLFTANTFKAAPVRLSKRHLSNGSAQAIIANSGNANCFTGTYGLIYAERMAEMSAKALSIKKQDVLVASTGIIGKPLPITRIEKGLPKLVKSLSKDGSFSAAEAILTTDTFRKEIAVQIKIGGSLVNIAAIAKGAGMISPKLSTMLCFITTDALITRQALRYALKLAADRSFNSITVDGCMSTNDTVFVLANGLAKNPCIGLRDKNFISFCQGLSYVCLEMAKAIVKDAEGATKFIQINVEGAKDEAMAREIGLSVANSDLFKTAVYGESPNWGRIIAAVGSVGLKMKEDDVRIKFSSFRRENVKIDIMLNMGKAGCAIYTSDLTPEYIKINAEYS